MKELDFSDLHIGNDNDTEGNISEMSLFYSCVDCGGRIPSDDVVCEDCGRATEFESYLSSIGLHAETIEQNWGIVQDSSEAPF